MANRHLKNKARQYHIRISNLSTLLFLQRLLLEKTSSKFLYVKTVAQTESTISIGTTIKAHAVTSSTVSFCENVEQRKHPQKCQWSDFSQEPT